MTKNNKLKVLPIFMALILISACTEPDAAEPRPYILSFSVTSSAAVNIAFTVEDLYDENIVITVPAGLPPLTIEELSGFVDYSEIRLYRVAAEATALPPGESFTVEIWYEEVEEFPPDNSRRLIKTVTEENEIAGVNSDMTIYIDFAVPYPAGY